MRSVKTIPRMLHDISIVATIETLKVQGIGKIKPCKRGGDTFKKMVIGYWSYKKVYVFMC